MTIQSEPDSKLSQLDKFKEAARHLECDEDEAAFEEKLKKITPPKPATNKPEEDKPA